MVDAIVKCDRRVVPPTAYEILYSYIEMEIEEVGQFVRTLHNF